MPHYTDGLSCVERLRRVVEYDLDAQDFIAVLVVIRNNVHVCDPGIAENLLQDRLDDLLRRLLLNHGNNPSDSAPCVACGQPIHQFGVVDGQTMVSAIVIVKIRLPELTST